eukprot:CAMPEP_0197840752 /NCGR_PEP_ID=MMETSP1437-20131217/45785_1 /TAXON_ID=49252 ORGANISM="Eucampia antarctica, Strain CCMP1452" /NCGR_SAMPLE_ID=MMETSP1437 /ASSEMBLY_ACC=CAM_ASM_001096 /LENGTH=628 /DNA_ID=CAMNT_0043450409 /DNA_START=128 /DNA_END=2017 /DNA_ORIENTATION=-
MEEQFTKPLEEDMEQDVLDLVEDLREMYDTADSFLRKNHSKWTKGRHILFYDRAQTEAYILSPLLKLSQDDDDNDDNDNENNSRKRGKGHKQNDMTVSFYEKSVRVHQPPHPDAWLSYIKYILGRPLRSPKRKKDGTMMMMEMETPSGMTAMKLRHVRGLFEKAMSTVKRQKQSSLNQATPQLAVADNNNKDDDDSMRDYDLALWNLCHEFLQFEKTFGSSKSYVAAFKLSKVKITNPESIVVNVTAPSILSTSPAVMEDDHYSPSELTQQHDEIAVTSTTTNNNDNDNDNGAKRKLSSVDSKNNDPMKEDDNEPQSKKTKSSDIATLEWCPDEQHDIVTNESNKDLSIPNHTISNKEDDDDDNSVEEKQAVNKKTNLKAPKLHPEYKLWVGNLEFPAHPFTVHVSNLSPDTQDMDLVDLFGSKCGVGCKIVFARIFREKFNGASKCAGLVQFEERESVDLALELNGIVGLHEKLIDVKRSHMSAIVSVVPPGMTKVKPKGEGKSTKRNLQRKEKIMNQHAATTTTANDKNKKSDHFNRRSVKPQNKVVQASPVVVAVVEENTHNNIITTAATATKNDDTLSSKSGTTTKEKTSSSNHNPYILAFRPRAVSNKARKPKVSLKGNEDDS